MKFDIKEEETNPKAFKRMYKHMICQKTGKCDRCPMHGGQDNTGRIPKDDRYKDRRKVRYDQI